MYNFPVKLMSPLTSNLYVSLAFLPIPTLPLVSRLVNVPRVVNDESTTLEPNAVEDNTSLFAILYTLLADKSKFSLICHVEFDELYVIYLSLPPGPNTEIPPPSAVASVGEGTFPNTIFLSSTISVSESKITVLPSTVKEPFTIILSKNVLIPDISWSPSIIPKAPVAPWAPWEPVAP